VCWQELLSALEAGGMVCKRHDVKEEYLRNPLLGASDEEFMLYFNELQEKPYQLLEFQSPV
jgi:hypothetical protein